MRRFLFTLMLMLLSLGAWGQYAGTGTVTRAGITILVANGIGLSLMF